MLSMTINWHYGNLMNTFDSTRHIVYARQESLILHQIVTVNNLSGAISLACESERVRILDALTLSILALNIIHFLSMGQLLVVLFTGFLNV